MGVNYMDRITELSEKEKDLITGGIELYRDKEDCDGDPDGKCYSVRPVSCTSAAAPSSARIVWDVITSWPVIATTGIALIVGFFIAPRYVGLIIRKIIPKKTLMNVLNIDKES